MTPFLYSLLSAIGTVAVSALLTHRAVGWAIRQNLVDTPNHRSSHSIPTPRGGGVAIVCAFYAGILSMWAYGLLGVTSVALLACGIPIAAIGYIDDVKSLSVRVRLMVHLACAVTFLWILWPLPVLSLGGFALPPIVTAVLYAAGLIWLTNLYNFMDGIDGIAASQAIAIGLLWAAVMPLDTAIAPVLLAAAALGFLFYNAPPARIFMGDVGSGFCGFICGALAIMLAQGTATPVLLWMIPLMPFACDATITLLVRMWRGKQPGIAHRSHVYQRLARQVGGHAPITWGFVGVTVLLTGPLFLWAADAPNDRAGTILLTITFALSVAALLLKAGYDE